MQQAMMIPHVTFEVWSQSNRGIKSNHQANAVLPHMFSGHRRQPYPLRWYSSTRSEPYGTLLYEVLRWYSFTRSEQYGSLLYEVFLYLQPAVNRQPGYRWEDS